MSKPMNPETLERAFLAASFMEEERAAALERRKEKMSNLMLGGDRKGAGETAREAAIRRAGGKITPQYVNWAESVLKKGIPLLIERIRAGKISLRDGAKIADYSERQQQRVLHLERYELAARLKHTTRRIESRNRDRAPLTITQPGTPFVRKILSGLERTALACAEEGVGDAEAIHERFAQEMQWDNPSLRAQFQRAMPIVAAMLPFLTAQPVKQPEPS